MVDASHEKEARAKETIAQLKSEITNLSRLVEQGAGLSMGQESQVNELLKDNPNPSPNPEPNPNQPLTLTRVLALGLALTAAPALSSNPNRNPNQVNELLKDKDDLTAERDAQVEMSIPP